jgi:hypothetical protein
MIFILDTNVISDIVRPKPNPEILAQIAAHGHDTLCLCEPVDYEVRRGYLKTNAVTRLNIYEQQIKPEFEWVTVEEADWRQAAQLWAMTVSRGRQLSDIDLLIAAIAIRVGGFIVSADTDFDALAVKRVDWKKP